MLRLHNCGFIRANGKKTPDPDNLHEALCIKGNGLASLPALAQNPLRGLSITFKNKKKFNWKIIHYLINPFTFSYCTLPITRLEHCYTKWKGINIQQQQFPSRNRSGVCQF
jgi:hypothetical protein